MEKELNILLVEDDKTACDELVREIDANCEDFRLIGVTSNADQAFELIIQTDPDAVILDLELHHGGGDGLELLKRVRERQFSRPPFVLVTTNNISSITHKAARELGADFIMTKNQSGYSAKSVLEFLKITKSAILVRKPQSEIRESYVLNEQNIKRTNRRICNELNIIGINPKSLGYKYLIDGINITMQGSVPHICDVIGRKYEKSGNSVERAMQNAINTAWSTSDTEVLLANYTARIHSDRGVPTLTEFIFYYAQKLNNE